MGKLLLILLCATALLRAEWDQLFSDEEDPTLFHHVNVITGNLNLCLQDAVIEGAKPLPIFRTYSSAGALESPELNAQLKRDLGEWVVQGGWNFFPHTRLLIEPGPTIEEFGLSLSEPGGNLIPWRFSHKEADHVFIFKPVKGFGQCSGNLSAKTNIANYLLKLDTARSEALLLLPNGGSRLYKGEDLLKCFFDYYRARVFYQLIWEVMPSGHKIHYSYDSKRRLAHVSTKNPSGTKTWSSLHLEVLEKNSPIVIGAKTSDGKSLRYKTLSFKDVDYIYLADCPSRAREHNGFIKGRKGIGARMNQMVVGDRLQFFATYYTPPSDEKAEKWAKDPASKDFETDKVRSLKAPLGPNGEMITFARFAYRPGVTEVRDSQHRLTRYRHKDGLLTSIEYCNTSDDIVSILKFIWKGDRLRAKALLDGDGQAHFSKVFDYDDKGNVVQETLWGSLTGSQSGPYTLNKDGTLAGAESYSRYYTWLPKFNLPVEEREDNGLTHRHEYKRGTDLPIAEFTLFGDQIIHREFFEYDEDNLLIAEIVDDGHSPDPNNLSHITERHSTRYDLDPSSGLIRAKTESYLDLASGTEKLLTRSTYTYSPQKRIIAEDVYDSEEQLRYTLHTDYDDRGRVIRKTTPLGQENNYSYDAFGYLLTSKEVSSSQKIFTYDAAGRPASVEEIDDHGTITKTLTHYDAHGNLLSQTDPRGNTTSQTYDPFGRCTSTTFPEALDADGRPYSPTILFTYDLQGNLASTCIAGNTTQTLYNSLRKPVLITHPDGTTLRHFYNTNGTQSKTIHPDDSWTAYEHDGFLRMTSKKCYSSHNELLSTETWQYNTFHLLSHTDPNGLTTHYTYDGAGRKIAEQAEARRITHTYDSLGFLQTTTQAEITHVQLHDVEGRVLQEWQQTPDGRIENHMSFAYDHENHKIKATRITSEGEAHDHFFYDREHRLTRHVDPHSNTTQFLYSDTETNTLGQRVLQKRTIDPLGNQTLEIHDALGHPVCLLKKDPSGHIVSQEDYSYDTRGNRARTVSTLYQNHTPKSQYTVQYDHDCMNRVYRQTEEGDKVTWFDYDIKGRLIKRSTPNGVTIHTAYDALDRPLIMASSDGTIHYRYTYATGPEPIAVHDLVHNTLLRREYNTFGQLTKETSPHGFTTTWQFDHHGRCTTYTLPDRSSIAYIYSCGHLVNISRYSPDGTSPYTHRYTDFDPNGHVREEQLIHHGLQHTHHDLLERPAHQTSPWLTQSISYGPSSLVTHTHNSLLGDKSYTYDALGQLTQAGDEPFSFDSLGNPIHSTINNHNQIISTPDSTFEYDRNGNRLKKTAPEGITTYTYDALDRLTTITHPDNTHTHLFYDAFSRLISEQTNDTRHYLLYDKSLEIGTLDAHGHILHLKVLGLGPSAEAGRSVAIEISGTPYAPLHDFQGNIIALISPDHNLLETYHLSPFGREDSQTPLNPWRFCAKRSLHGLIYFGHRFYDPSLGRWLTPDPSGFADGPNLYTYVLNSPLNRLDLFGLFSLGLHKPEIAQARLDEDRQRCSINVSTPKLMIAALVPRSYHAFRCDGFSDGVHTDNVVSGRNFHQLKFTNEQIRTGKVNIIENLHQLVPAEGRCIGLIAGVNGICNQLRDVFNNAHTISNMVPEGTLTILQHNQSKGLVRDTYRSLRELDGEDTKPVRNFRPMMVTLVTVLRNINPDALIDLIPHSEGGVITYNAINGMTYEEQDLMRQHLIIHAYAPAKPIPKSFGRDVINTYSKRDSVTGWFVRNHLNDPEYEIRLVSSRGSWFTRTFAIPPDHPLLGKTYKSEMFEDFNKERKKWGFYDGTKR